MAAIAIVGLVGLAVYLIAKLEGVNVSDVAGQLEQGASEEVSSLSAQAGLSNDPISIALPIIKQFEGFSANAYNDPPGSSTYSIGYGHQIKPGEPYDQNSSISESEASDLLRGDVATAFSCVSSNVTSELSPQQTAALISFVYNVGCGAFESSSMLKLINQGDFESASAQFPQWIHAGGQVSQALISRRSQEQELFNS